MGFKMIEDEDSIYLIRSYTPFERHEPINSETLNAKFGELSLMGYRDDVINFPDFKIYKVNKYLFINLINERTIKKYDDVNLNDKYILKKILNGVFNNIVQGDNNNITDETKYTNKISMVLNNKLTTFYDFYTTDINVIKKIAEILIENMILNIKAQSVLKDHLRSTELLAHGRIRQHKRMYCLYRGDASLRQWQHLRQHMGQLHSPHRFQAK